jgi:hypothetical protein
VTSRTAERNSVDTEVAAEILGPRVACRARSTRGLCRHYLSYPTDEDRFRDGVLACLSLDLRAGRIGLCLKFLDREGEQPEVVVVRPVTMGWTRAAIASFAKSLTLRATPSTGISRSTRRA